MSVDRGSFFRKTEITFRGLLGLFPHGRICSCIAVAIFVSVSVLPASTFLKFVEELAVPDPWTRVLTPKWSNGALLTVQYFDTPNPVIWVFDRNGQRAVPFNISGTRWMHIYGWDRGADGTIALSGSVTDSDGRGSSFIAWISQDGSESQVIHTARYAARGIAVAPDGTLWTAGRELAVTSTGRPSNSMIPNAGVIRHFDRFGRLLGSYVPQSTVGDPLVVFDGRNGLRASRDRVAWCSVDGRYVEISLDGNVLTDIFVPPPGNAPKREIDGFALSDSGEAFLGSSRSATDDGGNSVELRGIYGLDRSTKAWTPLLQRSVARGQSKGWDDVAYLYGIDGNRLVLMGDKRARFYRIRN